FQKTGADGARGFWGDVAGGDAGAPCGDYESCRSGQASDGAFYIRLIVGDDSGDDYFNIFFREEFDDRRAGGVRAFAARAGVADSENGGYEIRCRGGHRLPQAAHRLRRVWIRRADGDLPSGGLECSVNRMSGLAFGEVNFASVFIVVKDHGTAFAAHFDGLHEINHVHLGKIAADDAVGRRGLGHFFQRYFVNDALNFLRGLAEEKRLFDEVVHGIVMGEGVGDVGFAGEHDYGDARG